MHRLGQHFLVNTAVLQKIADAVGAQPHDTIVEIGPGHGELTGALVNSEQWAVGSTHLIAIERDEKLAEELKKKFVDNVSVEVVVGDALDVLPQLTAHRSLHTAHWKVVGNIPYYITGHLFRTLGELPEPPACAVFLIQEEVAERAVAEPPRMNRLAASIRLWAEPKLLFRVPRGDFRPQPKVDSAVILLDAKPLLPSRERTAIDRLIGILFRQPRKTVLNNLRAGYDLSAEELAETITLAGLRPTDRPQNVSFDQLTQLAKYLHKTP